MQKMPVEVFPASQEAVAKLAAETAELIRTNGVACKQRVLGIATSGIPIAYYNKLVRFHKEGFLSLKSVTSYNLYAFAGLPEAKVESYWHFMHQKIFNQNYFKPRTSISHLALSLQLVSQHIVLSSNRQSATLVDWIFKF
ncbi:MAG: hypothetical protein ABGY95_01485 [Rubritalea sp.]|uniref:hypothetical protein n=1 Tax=Rubritalea sp. TaxID=2109375 RepID=UPI0032428A24